MNELRCPLAGNWKLDVETSDEFDGDALDHAKWWDYAPEWRGRKTFLYSHENVAVKNGLLELSATAIPPESMAYEDREDGIQPILMPIVKSKKKVRYGYFECRAKTALAEVSCAFWLYDPLSGSGNRSKKYKPGFHSEEIDIYEIVGKYQPLEGHVNAIRAHVHRFLTPYVEGLVNSQKTFLPDAGGFVEVPWEPSDAFHTYGLLWTPEELVWYCDEKPYHRRANDFFHTDLHVMFDCESSGWCGMVLDKATLPATHSVDWFRRWVME